MNQKGIFLTLAVVAMGMVLFTACNTAISPTSASNPNFNAAIPQPPESALTTSVAFTGLGSNGDNAFTFVALQPLAAGVTLYFTNSGWDANSAQLVGGKTVAFVPSRTLPPGTQVLIEAGPVSAAAAASIVYGNAVTGVAGSLTTDGTPGDSMGMTKNVSAIIAYSIPSAGATQFLTALNENTSTSFLLSGPASKGRTYLPPGLKTGVNAIDLFKLQAENAVYSNCAVALFPNQLTAAQLLSELVNPSNWTNVPGGGSSVNLPGLGVSECDYTGIINPIPTAVPTPWTGPSPTPTPLPCGYPGPTCTPTDTATPGGGLNPGDITITGLTFNGDSEISFVSTTGLTAGQVLYFTNYSYDATVPGLVDESTTCCTSGSNNLTVTEGVISFTAGSGGLSAYNQVIIGNTGNQTNVLQGGAVASVTGNGGNPWLVFNHNGNGHKVLAYCVPSAGVTTWLTGVLFGPDSWQTSGSIGSSVSTTVGTSTVSLPAFWDSYLPPGLNSTNSTDLSGLWASDNLNNFTDVSMQNDNAVLDSCQNTLAGIVDPAHWAADGNQSKNNVKMNPPAAITPCAEGNGGFTGVLP